MRLLSVFTLASLALSLNVFAEECEGHLYDSRSRVVQVYRGNICKENLKACSLEARKIGGRCERVDLRPLPPSYPTPQPPQYPPQNPYPVPQPVPQPPYNPGTRLPVEVERMTEIEMAINYVLEGCHVLPNVSGWANQLYVRGQFIGNYDTRQDMELRRAIRDLQYQGKCLMKDARTLNIQFEPNLINDAIDYSLSRNCHVLPRVSGWANQLYVNRQFIGNFDVNSQSEQMKLRASLADKLESGECQERSYQERQLLSDQYLIQDFANHQYRGCHVRLNVSGWANQLYVGNQFIANFDRNSEIKKLQSALVELVINRTCTFDPM